MEGIEKMKIDTASDGVINLNGDELFTCLTDGPNGVATSIRIWKNRAYAGEPPAVVIHFKSAENAATFFALNTEMTSRVLAGLKQIAAKGNGGH